MIAEALRRRLHDRAGHALRQRLVGIFVLARALEHVAARDLLAAQVAGLAGHAAQLLEAVVVRLELVVGDREILDRHLGRNGVLAVALGRDGCAACGRLGRSRQVTPFQCAPAPPTPGAGQERAEPADRQRRLRRRMAQRHGLHLGVLEQLLAHRVFEIVAHARAARSRRARCGWRRARGRPP